MLVSNLQHFQFLYRPIHQREKAFLEARSGDNWDELWNLDCSFVEFGEPRPMPYDVPLKQLPHRGSLSAFACSSSALRHTQSYHFRSSPAVEAANSHVFEEFRKAYDNTALDIQCSLQSRYPDWTVTLTSASTRLIAFADAGQSTAKLDVESQKVAVVAKP